MSTLELRHLDKRYPAGDWAVRDVELRIDDGELFVIVGPSGCGKSTLLRMITGLEQPTSGDVLVDRVNINRVRSNEREIAMAFQEYALYPHLTVAENIGFPMRVGHVHEAIVERRIDEVANVLHLTDVLDRRPSQLSGGQRQRVALGRAIVRRPRLLLMDEPMSNLDAKLRTQMRVVIMGLQRRLGLTTLYVTHDHDEAMAMGDRLAVMRAGRVEQCGVPIDVYDHPCNLFVAQFVGTPAMNAVVASVVESEGTIELRIGPHRTTIDDDQLRRRPIWRSLVGRDVALGVRPEEIRPDADGWLIGSVASTELVERRQLVTFDVDVRAVTTVDGIVVVGPTPRTSLVAAVDPDLSIGLWEPFRVTFDLDRAHLFDLSTGLTLD